MTDEELTRIARGYRAFVAEAASSPLYARLAAGRPLALTAPHGGRIDWLPGAGEIIAG